MSSQQPQLPQRPQQHQLADESVRFFANCLPPEWTHEERRKDYGVDIQVGIVRGNAVTGEELLVQLKSTSRSEPPGDSVAIELDVPTLNLLRNMLQVVLLVKYVATEGEAYWLLLKDFTASPPAGQKTVTIRLPRVNRLSLEPWEEIGGHVAAVHHKKIEANTREFDGPSLGPGLRSKALITNGVIRYDESSIPVRPLFELQHTISAGSLARDINGGLVATLQTTVPSRSLQALNERLGLNAFEMVCGDRELSIDPGRPSLFVLSEMTMRLEAGDSILNIATWEEVVLPVPVHATTTAEAVGHYDYRTGRFVGRFGVHITYRGVVTQEVRMAGTFEILLS